MERKISSQVLLFCCLLACVIGLTAISLAASANLNVNARMGRPISITETTEMDFGIVYISTEAGTAVLTNAGAISGTGGYVSSDGNQVSGIMTAIATPNATVNISLPSSITLTGGDITGLAIMTVDNFVSNPGTSYSSLVGNLSSQTIDVGGTLNFSANQELGTYYGTAQITVNY
ncbi:MAG: DUF4402 domain-containing protein [bacterium]|nr:DUF4402 domain-containing protein [bacterium]